MLELAMPAFQVGVEMFDGMFISQGMPLLMENLGMELTVKDTPEGDERTITAIVAYRRNADLMEESGEKEKELLWIQVARDPVTGIADPEYGLTVRRSEDDEDHPWSYQGQTENTTGVSWELLFGRIRPIRVGMKTR